MKAWQATVAIIICHILTGTASVSTRYLVTLLEPVEVAFIRYFLGGLILLPLLFIFRVEKLSHTLVLKITGLGILFFALFPFLFSWSFVYTTAARGSLVLATMPIWTIFISKLLGHEQLNKLTLFATGIALIGLTIALSDKLFSQTVELNSFTGELIMLGTAITGAVYAVFSRQTLRQVPASTMTPIAMLAGCACLLPFSINSGIDEHVMAMTNLQIGIAVYLGVVAGGIAFFLFNWALTRTQATFNTLFVTLNPITAIFLAYLFLGEGIEWNFIAGVFVVFAGLGLAVYAQKHELNT